MGAMDTGAAATEQELFKAASRMLRSEDPDEVHCAIENFRYLSRNGNARASFNMSIAYARGHGVQRDAAMAAHFMLRAARQGYPRSYEPLAHMIVKGDLLESRDLIPEGRHFVAQVWHFRACCDGQPALPAATHPLPYSAMYAALGPVRYR